MTGAAAPMPRDEAARLLGVAEDASPADVQRAFLRAARRVHPDRLPDVDDAGRRAAGAAFDRLTRARDALLVPLPAAPSPLLAVRPRSRGLGGSLVVLALMAFLLVAIMTAQQALSGSPGVGAPPAGTVSP